MLRCLQMSDYYCVKLQAWSNCQKIIIFCCCCCHINKKGAAEWATLTYVTYVTLKNSPKSCFIYCSLVCLFFYHLPLRVIHTHLTTGVTYLLMTLTTYNFNYRTNTTLNPSKTSRLCHNIWHPQTETMEKNIKERFLILCWATSELWHAAQI